MKNRHLFYFISKRHFNPEKLIFYFFFIIIIPFLIYFLDFKLFIIIIKFIYSLQKLFVKNFMSL
jgi:hypothetical protein